MKLPDFTELGSISSSVMQPAPQPDDAIARVDNPAIIGQAQQEVGAQTTQAGINLKNILDVADVNNVQANVFQPQLDKMAQDFYSLKGNAAVQAFDGDPANGVAGYPQQVRDMMNSSANTLTGSARTMAMDQMQHTVNNELYRASMHAGEQQIAYVDDSHKAQQSNILNDAVQHMQSGNFDTVRDDISHVQVQNGLFLKSKGIAPNSDMFKANQRELDATINATLFQNMTPVQQAKWGKEAIDAMGATTIAGGGAPNLGGDTVQPYTPQRIAEVKAMVAQPSQYDDLFQQAHEAYPNVSIADLKLHAAAESSMNAKADNGKAQGLMQLTPATAKGLGVTDPFDPEQSIMGAAKLMYQQSQAAGGSTQNADMLYYGGSNQSQWGANTKQYAANLAAVRGTDGQQLGQTISSANTPPLKLFGVDVAPEQALKMAELGMQNKEHADKIQQIQYDKDVQTFSNDPHFTSMLQVPPNITAGYALKPETQKYLEARADYNLKNSENIINSDKLKNGSGFYNLLQNISSPTGITDPRELYQYMGKGGILTVDGYNALSQEIEQKNSPAGQAIATAKSRLFSMGEDAIMGENKSFGISDPKGQQLHDKWLALTLNDYNSGIKAGKTPAQLLTPQSPDYIGKSISMFQRTPQEIMKDSLNMMAQNDIGNPSLDALEADRQSGKISADQARTKAIPFIQKLPEQADREKQLIRFGYNITPTLRVPRPQ